MDELRELLEIVKCIDGSDTYRVNKMRNLIYTIQNTVSRLNCQIGELTEAAERYRELADQRLLNHLNVDQEHIINICNESLQEVATDELSPMALGIDPYAKEIQSTLDPTRIPPISITEIDFQ